MVVTLPLSCVVPRALVVRVAASTVLLKRVVPVLLATSAPSSWVAPEPTAPVKIQVTGLPAGTYKLRVTRVGYRHNDVYTAYLDLGSPAGTQDRPWLLPKGVLAELQSYCTGQPTIVTMKIDEGERLTVELPMNQNDVYFVAIER